MDFFVPKQNGRSSPHGKSDSIPQTILEADLEVTPDQRKTKHNNHHQVPSNQSNSSNNTNQQSASSHSTHNGNSSNRVGSRTNRRGSFHGNKAQYNRQRGNSESENNGEFIRAIFKMLYVHK